MRKALKAILAVGLVIAASTSGALKAQERPLERAFEHYERIRAALAQDTTKGIALAPRTGSDLAAADYGLPGGQHASRPNLEGDLAREGAEVERDSSKEERCAPQKS